MRRCWPSDTRSRRSHGPRNIIGGFEKPLTDAGMLRILPRPRAISFLCDDLSPSRGPPAAIRPLKRQLPFRSNMETGWPLGTEPLRAEGPAGERAKK
jgi:hypothetical protein